MKSGLFSKSSKRKNREDYLAIEEIKNETRKYLWSIEKCKKYGIKRVGKRNIEKELGYDVTEYKEDRLFCKFIFAKNMEKILKI